MFVEHTFMSSVTSFNLHRFGSGLLVEVIDEGAADCSVRSFELEFVDADAGVVRPRSPLATWEMSLIEDALHSNGFEVDTSFLTT